MLKALSELEMELEGRSNDHETQATPRVGRPRAKQSAELVRFLREQGLSWRAISRTLDVGVTTARRLYKKTVS